jgi:4-hydroxythreonine-4-phosphate dehydrogenase
MTNSSPIASNARPWRIGITMGDPCGVGPEIIAKALARAPRDERHRFIVFGHLPTLQRACETSRLSLVCGEDGAASPADILVRNVPLQSPDWTDGRISAAGGDAAYRFIVAAVRACQAGEIDVIATAPLNKAALHAAGHHFDGHTELLAHLTGATQSFMLLASDQLSAIHTTTHVSLAEAIHRIRPPRIVETIRHAHRHFQDLGIAMPRIAVAGLNPHCGENGIFGSEDTEHIAPAVQQAVAEGMNVRGPISADTVFYRAMQGEFDVVVAHYHDQGHIPTKLVAFDDTVNVSLGLPIKRVSVDHGTAFDIAWSNQANHQNMMAALDYGLRMLGATPVFTAASNLP